MEDSEKYIGSFVIGNILAELKKIYGGQTVTRDAENNRKWRATQKLHFIPSIFMKNASEFVPLVWSKDGISSEDT